LDKPEDKTEEKPALSQHHHHRRHHHSHRDIGDKKIEEHVHGFATADKNVLPEPYPKQKVPYPQNGAFNPSWQWVDEP